MQYAVYTKEETVSLEAKYGTGTWKIGTRRIDETTGVQEYWDGTRWRHLTSTFGKGGVILDPSAARNVVIWRADVPCEVVAVRAYRVGGTGATINARKNGSLNHLASDLSLTSADTWMADTNVQNASYSAGDTLEIMLVSLNGSPTEISIQVDFIATST
jgi:hypothetical protein